MATAAGAGGDGGGQLRVLGAWPSPFVNRVRMALQLKGLEYENVEEDLTNKSELLLASNPVHKKVPVLLHAGRPVPESLVVLEYLDDAFTGAGPALLPADSYQRAVARFWAAFVDGKLHGAMVAALMGATEEARAAATADAFAALDALEGALAESSGGKGFFAGDAPGFVDVALGGYIHRVAARVGQDHWRRAPRRRPGPAARRVGGALRRARRRQGGHPGPGATRRVRQGAAGTLRCSCDCEQLMSSQVNVLRRHVLKIE